MKTLRIPTMTKFNRFIDFYGSDFPIWFYSRGGCYSMYGRNSRNRFFGIKGLFGVCFRVEW